MADPQNVVVKNSPHQIKFLGRVCIRAPTDTWAHQGTDDTVENECDEAFLPHDHSCIGGAQQHIHPCNGKTNACLRDIFAASLASKKPHARRSKT